MNVHVPVQFLKISDCKKNYIPSKVQVVKEVEQYGTMKEIFYYL